MRRGDRTQPVTTMAPGGDIQRHRFAVVPFIRTRAPILFAPMSYRVICFSDTAGSDTAEVAGAVANAFGFRAVNLDVVAAMVSALMIPASASV